MKSNELRQKFLQFFENNGHKIMPSSSLIPQDDPSVLLTTAGMQQFKPYFAGNKDVVADFQTVNLASIQKCFRTSDIEEVGDETHLTFFEMLGNFSIGGYGKEQAIEYALKFLLEVLGLPQEKLVVTVFKGDERLEKDQETADLWQKLAPGVMLREGTAEDNFWGPTGIEGPCGPSTEILYRLNDEYSVEIWNLVFTQYFCDQKKQLEPLGKTYIDTGMGLERLAMVVQQKKTIFDSDLFWDIIGQLEKLSGKVYKTSMEDARRMRIIADHLRATTFLMADGVSPANKDRGYILRRLIRRSLTHARFLNEGLKSLFEVALAVVKNYQGDYPNLSSTNLNVLKDEEEKFQRTLDAGLKEFHKLGTDISAEQAFLLYQSYGFPIEVTMELAKDDGKMVDRAGFDAEVKKHQQISRKS